MDKKEFIRMEKEYDTWLEKHPKSDHNYKSFSHMRRSIEFAKYYSEKVAKNTSNISYNKVISFCEHKYILMDPYWQKCTLCGDLIPI